MALGRRRREKPAFVPPKLQITSMMDMFTIILIFLLFSFSDQPDPLTLDGQIQLPESTARRDYTDGATLVLSKTVVKLDDEVIAQVRNGKIVGMDSADLKASDLYHKLSMRKAEEKNLSAPGDRAPILFLCDKGHAFDTINIIMKTAGLAGYPDIQFGVLKK